jgi:UDP-sulfoquinovose synthase
MELAYRVQESAAAQGIKVEIQHLRNPRVEQEKHYYHAVHSGLEGLGLEPHLLNNGVIGHMLEKALNAASRVNEASILPKVDWKHGRQQAVQGIDQVTRPNEAPIGLNLDGAVAPA